MISSVLGAASDPAKGVAAHHYPARDGPSFAQTLQGALAPTEGIRFSAHAEQRLSQRAIQLTPTQHERLDEALGHAAATGARESLLLMDGLAFVVNVPKRTVITAIPVDDLRDMVITNIDSAVVTPSGTGPRKYGNGAGPLVGGSRAADCLMRRNKTGECRLWERQYSPA